MYKIGNTMCRLFRSSMLSLKDAVYGFTPYVGYPKNGNIGDEHLYHLALRYLKPANLIYDMFTRGRLLKVSLLGSKGYYLVGGGSLIFGKDFISKFERLSSLGFSPIFWGTGSRELPTDQNQQKHWNSLLKEAQGGVRGVLTQQCFQKIGLNVEVIGDTGFLINLDFDTNDFAEDYVVIIPRLIPFRNALLHALDLKRLDYLKDLVDKLASLGVKIVVYLPCMEDAPDLQLWLSTMKTIVHIQVYNGEIDPFIKLVRGAKAVVSMRLHPGIFAYALGTPTAFIEARDKYFDAISILSDKPAMMDVNKFSKEELLKHVVDLLQEDLEMRKERFRSVRTIALNQLERSKKIASLLVG